MAYLDKYGINTQQIVGAYLTQFSFSARVTFSTCIGTNRSEILSLSSSLPTCPVHSNIVSLFVLFKLKYEHMTIN